MRATQLWLLVIPLLQHIPDISDASADDTSNWHEKTIHRNKSSSCIRVIPGCSAKKRSTCEFVKDSGEELDTYLCISETPSPRHQRNFVKESELTTHVAHRANTISAFGRIGCRLAILACGICDLTSHGRVALVVTLDIEMDWLTTSAGDAFRVRDLWLPWSGIKWPVFEYYM
jgi:hypothetical protein